MTLAYILTEGITDIEILRRLLPQNIIQDTKLINGEGAYGARSLAGSLLATRSIPVALVLDADTEDESLILEKYDLVNNLLHQASAGVPFKVFLVVPQMEVILLQNKSLIEKIANRKFNDLEWQLAHSQPKRFLTEVLKEDSQQQGLIEKIFSNLSEKEIKVLQQHSLIQDLINFLSSLTAPV